MNQREYLITTLMEECSELIKDGSKALRFGDDSKNENDELSAIEKLYREFIDIAASIELLLEYDIIKDIDYEMYDTLIADKKKRVVNYMNEHTGEKDGK